MNAQLGSATEGKLGSNVLPEPEINTTHNNKQQTKNNNK